MYILNKEIKKMNDNIYFVQVTDKFDTTGPCMELHENLSASTARRLVDDCEMVYPEISYHVTTNVPRV